MHIYTEKIGLRKVKQGVTQDKLLNKYPDALFIKSSETPSMEYIEQMLCDDVVETSCECRVEPDGHCQHGAPSWLLIMGLI